MTVADVGAQNPAYVLGLACSLVACATAAKPDSTACRPTRAVMWIFEAKEGAITDAERLRPSVEGISRAQLVIGKLEAVVAIDGDVDLESAKARILPEARALGLEFTVEDRGAIDESCTVRLEHRDAPIQKR